jgi:hypothetical protein
MARVKTFVNGGNVLPSDLDTIEDDYEVAFGTYKHLRDVVVRLDAPAAGTYILVPGYTGAGVAASSAQGAMAAHWLDPNRYWGIASTSSANPRSVYYDLGVSAITNNTAVGTVTFTAGLYAVTGTTGTGATQTGVTLSGSAVGGSTVAVTNPAASTVVNGSWSGDFAAPAAGFYALAVVVSAAAAASSSITLRANLTVRQY